MGSASNSTQAGSHYSKYLPDLSQPRFTTMSQQDAHEYAKEFKQHGRPPWLHALWRHWRDLFDEPFKGITTDGNVKPDLFHLQDEGMPIDTIVGATNKLLSLLSNEEKNIVSYHIDSPDWRSWSNPEFLLSDKGLRLEDVDQNIRTAIMNVLAATLSPEGYEKAVSAMRINHFLGELCQAEKVCNENSYNFVLFGTPSTNRPWGISFYGHHLCLNIFFYKTQVIMSPWFTGAEPNEIDSGPYAGTRILRKEEALGLRLMQSLPAKLQSQAQIFKLMKDPAMPPGRWNRDDQRHLCGAFRDNRIVPYEGVPITSFSPDQQSLVYDIVSQFLLYLPAKAREIRLANIRDHAAETFFSWIGGFKDADPFYFRIQSPVIVVEFDHHSGVFLNNSEPAKFHIHTLLRTPNGGDYGMALRPLVPAVEQSWVWEEDLK